MTYLTLPYVSRLLDIPERTLRDRHYARGVGVRIGRMIVFDPGDLPLLRRWPWAPGRPEKVSL